MVYAYFRDADRRHLYKADVAAAIDAQDRHAIIAEAFNRSNAPDLLSALQYLDLKTYLPGDILTKVDVASMYSSLEVRVPLLDHHIVELAGQVPTEMRLFAPDGTLQQKYLLKRYINRLLPGDAFARPKHGFGVPIDRWFGPDLFDRVRARLLYDGGSLLEWFDRRSLEELVATPAAAQANAPRVWALLFLHAWSDVHGVS